MKYAVENLAVTPCSTCAAVPGLAWGPAGELCACRAAGLLQRFNVTTPAQSLTQLSAFLNERWKGVRPIAWGDALREKRIHPLGLPRPVRTATGASG